jgi:PAS domain S-box-containing protein
MSVPTDETQPNSARQILHDIQAVNEQLLIAGLREQTAAEQLRHQLAFITAITTSLSEGVIAVNATGHCTFVNPAAEYMLGWTRDELRGKDMSAVIPIASASNVSGSAVFAAIRDALHLGKSYRNDDAQFAHRDQGMRPVALSIAPIITGDHVIGAVVMFRDMTEVRRLQQIREEYLTLISHDLRSPLTVILVYTQMLQQRLTKNGFVREAHDVEIVVENSLRMNDMIEGLLERSDPDMLAQASYRSEINLGTLVQQMIDQTVTPGNATRVTLHATLSPVVVVNVVQISRVIVNLLTNAFKFSPPEAPIVVQVYHHATDAIIAVTDQGIGIAPEDVPRVFEKHYRTQSARHIAGYGLGLYTSRLIVEAHGGRIYAESTVGVGSTFTVALPL